MGGNINRIILILFAVLSFNCVNEDFIENLVDEGSQIGVGIVSNDIESDASLSTVNSDPVMSDSDRVAKDKTNLAIIYGGTDTALSVTQNVILSTKGDNGTTITWATDNIDYVEPTGLVKRPTYDIGNKNANLTATITMNNVSDTKVFGLTIIAIPKKTGCTQFVAGFQESYGLCNGQVVALGIDNFNQQTLPTFSTPTFVSAGANNGFVIDSTGTIGWGRDDANQITNIPSKTQTTSIDGGMWKMACSMDNNSGYVDCWGDQASQPTWTNVIEYDVGWTVVCAITGVTGSTTLKCIGSGAVVPTVTNPVKVAVGRAHVCSIESGATNESGIKCAGSNIHNELNVPTGIVNPRQIEAGEYHTVVIADNGIFAWGKSDEGQTAIPNINVNDIVHFDASHRNTWYTLKNGLSYCRGDNSWNNYCPLVYDTTK